MNIFLCGYMASGKSSIGKELAGRMSVDFLDTDRLVEEAFDLTVYEIFTQLGEAVFRDAEHQVIQFIAKSSEAIVALGGGSVCVKENLELVKSNGSLIYLQADAELLVQRILDDKVRRPLLDGINEDGLPLFIRSHLNEREKWYGQAHHIIDIKDKTIQQLVDEIIETLHIKI